VSDSLRQALADGALQVVFQPIFDVSLSHLALHGVEALVRGPAGTPYEDAGFLFDEVARRGDEVWADRACVAAIMAAAGELPPGLPVGVNVYAATLARDPEFPRFVQDTAQGAGLLPERLVLEVGRAGAVSDSRLLRAPLEALRANGMAVALDDVGLGQASYRTMLECRPDFFKLDGFVVKGAGLDPLRQAVVRSLVVLADGFGARVVAEWIEEPGDLHTVKGLGVTLVQGRLFLGARPAREMDVDLDSLDAAAS
jgi:EAL domain-containing protein (putative c-di-GMP-specific phosphodiesterase class I)